MCIVRFGRLIATIFTFTLTAALDLVRETFTILLETFGFLTFAPDTMDLRCVRVFVLRWL